MAPIRWKWTWPHLRIDKSGCQSDQLASVEPVQHERYFNWKLESRANKGYPILAVFLDQKGQPHESQLYACFSFYFLCFKSLQTTENFQGIWFNIKCFEEGLKILNEYQTQVGRISKVKCFMKGASNLKLEGLSVWAKNDFSVWNDQGWQKDN